MNSLTQNNGQIIHFGTNTTTDLSGVPSRYISIRRNALTSQLICEIGGGFENQATAYVFTATFDIILDQWNFSAIHAPLVTIYHYFSAILFIIYF